jgi:hypothetical protein
MTNIEKHDLLSSLYYAAKRAGNITTEDAAIFDKVHNNLVNYEQVTVTSSEITVLRNALGGDSVGSDIFTPDLSEFNPHSNELTLEDKVNLIYNVDQNNMPCSDVVAVIKSIPNTGYDIVVTRTYKGVSADLTAILSDTMRGKKAKKSLSVGQYVMLTFIEHTDQTIKPIITVTITI